MVAVLNALLIWWFNWRYLLHMLNDALIPLVVRVENLPIALPSDEIRAKVEPAVARLIALTQQDQATRHELLD